MVPFAIIYWLCLQLEFKLALAGGIAAVTAALISMSLSVLFLSKPREQAAQSIVDWRNRDRTADDIAEDAAIEAEDAATEANPTPATSGTTSAPTAAMNADAHGTDPELIVAEPQGAPRSESAAETATDPTAAQN